MNALVLDALVQRLRQVDANLLKVTQDLGSEQLSRRLGPTAPPIGWHLWHIARWADCFQASFPERVRKSSQRLDVNRELWHREGLAQRWGLEPTKLGRFETGMGMEHAVAAQLPHSIGQKQLLDYARRAFHASEQALENLAPSELESPRESMLQLESTGESTRPIIGKATTNAADALYHINHANRHLGSIEALRGLFEMDGADSI